MEQQKIKHLLYVPFTGLGLYGGYRGSRWLKNRITIFKQFVVPSLMAQTNKDFTLWVSWRHEEIVEPLVAELEKYLKLIFPSVVFTYGGVCFWDDKYPDDMARKRLAWALHESAASLFDVIGQAEQVLMTIQPSDDCYYNGMVEEMQTLFKNNPEINVFGYAHGYVMDYVNRTVAEWNPATTPPFYTIRFPKKDFLDPNLHMKYTGPYKSHEYVKNFLTACYLDKRGFLVGTHGENISTIFKHPYTGKKLANEWTIDNFEGHMFNDTEDTLMDFGLYMVPPLRLKFSVRKWIMRQLPHWLRRKIRYYLGERFYAKWYNWVRS